MRVAAGGVTALLCVAIVACSGGSSEPRPAPTLLPPEISPALQIIGEGTLDLDVGPGERQLIEPLALARSYGTPPDCARLAFIFRWRLDDDAELRFVGRLRGATVAVEQGNSGSASVGCMVVEAVNDSKERITGDLRYYIAAAR